MLQWDAVFCNALLQCVAMFYRNRLARRLSAAPMYVAQFRMMLDILVQCVVAVCCSVLLQCVCCAVWNNADILVQCVVAECCNVLQFVVAVCIFHSLESC